MPQWGTCKAQMCPCRACLIGPFFVRPPVRVRFGWGAAFRQSRFFSIKSDSYSASVIRGLLEDRDDLSATIYLRCEPGSALRSYIAQLDPTLVKDCDRVLVELVLGFAA